MPRGYSLGAMNDAIYPTGRPLGTSGTDLNTLYGRDNEGIWYQTHNNQATSALNYPEGYAGALEVIVTNAGANTSVIQRYTSYGGDVTYVRGMTAITNGVPVWTPWDKYVQMSQLYKAIYPVGICLDFDAAVNPNTLFPGTTWTQITDNRVVRTATSNVTGTASGQIGFTTGNNSVTLTENNIPAHTHTMNHAHTASSNSTGAHTHSVTGTAESAGAHTHSVEGTIGDPGSNWHINWETSNNDDYRYQNTSSAGAHTHSVTGTAASNGDHSHTISVAPLTAGTGSVGSGAAFNITNPCHYYARWKRTA